jgi:ABC-type transporter Mla MlaB component
MARAAHGPVTQAVRASGADRLPTVCALLNAARVQYVVVGGFALVLHGVVRTTKDVDILIEPSLANVRRALRALEQLPFGVASDLDPAEVAAKQLTIVGDNPRVDLLTLAWSVRYADAAPGALSADVDGVTVPYADVATLIRSKQTGRLQDRADIEALERLKQL